jgi:hypothetical protein
LAGRLTINDPTGATLEAEAKKNHLPIHKTPKLKLMVATIFIDFVTQNAPKQN